MPQIVYETVTQQQAPTPNGLQKTGAFISQGATALATGASVLLTQLSDLTSHLNGAKNLTSLTWGAGTVTAVTAAPHGFSIGDTIYLTIAGSVGATVPNGANGTFLCTITGASGFTYSVAITPGTISPAGTYTVEDVAELISMATTFFAQGSNQAVYVLELGPGNATDGSAYLSAWITANPGIYYSYLVPREWDGNAGFLSLMANFQNTTAKTYFFTTTTLQTYTAYTALQKACCAWIENPTYGTWPTNVLTAFSQTAGAATATTTTVHGVVPGDYFTLTGCVPIGWNGTYLALAGTTGSTLVFTVPSTLGVESVLGSLVASVYASTGIPALEFSAAAPFYVSLNYNPSNTNRVTPFAFSYIYGVTPFMQQGNSALLTTLAAANINVVSTGAEGGISTALIYPGVTKDGRQFTYWYSIDWEQINTQLAAANAVINGSNNPINPLYYNQPGINAVQQVVASTTARAVTYGMANGTVVQTGLDGSALTDAISSGTFNGKLVVNAIPFITYVAENPSDYKLETYSGISVIYITQAGFIRLNFNILVTDFVAI